MLVVLKLDRVDHLDVALVALDTLYERLAEHEVIDVSVEERMGREGPREPRLSDTRIKDATTVGEAGHVPVEQFGRGGDGHGTEDLGLLAGDPVVIVETKEESKDDVGNVTEPEGREELLGDADGRHELAHTKDETPPLSGAELTEQGEGELSENRAGVDRGTKGDEAAELVTDLGANTGTQSEIHGARALRVADVSQLRTARSSGDVVDDVTKVESKLLETPSPESRVGTLVFGVTGFEVGTDVGDPNIETLVDEPEGHGAFFVNDKVGGIAKNTVLQDDRVTDASTTTGIGDAVGLEDPTALSDDLVLITLVAPEFGIVGGTTGAALASDPALVFAIGLCLWRRLFKRVKVGKVGSEKDSAESSGADTEGESLAEVESQTLERAVVSIISDDVVEEGHLKGSLCLVIGESGIEERSFIAVRVATPLLTGISHDFNASRARRLLLTTIELVGSILERTVFCFGAT